MATLTDTFTTLDTAIWDTWTDGGSATVEVTGSPSQLHILPGAVYYDSAGVCTDITYDITAPGSVECDLKTVDYAGAVYVTLQKIAATGQFVEELNDWYRFGLENGTWYFRKRVGGGTASTIGSGTPGSGNTGIYQLDFPTTGDDVRAIKQNEGTPELASDPTYALTGGSRDVYFILDGVRLYGANDTYWDDFSATYTAAAGGNAPTGQIHGCLYGPLGGVI